MARYSGDPYWLTARYDGKCHRCKTTINAGTRAFYYPNGKRLLCESEHCGGEASAEFSAAAFDEDFATGAL